MGLIKGVLSAPGRLIIMNESNQQILINESREAGSYEYSGLTSHNKIILAQRTSDGKIIAYGRVIPAGEPPIDASWTIQTGVNDGFISSGTIYNNWADIRMAAVGDSSFIRWTNIGIPQGSIIEQAWVRWWWDTIAGDYRAPCTINGQVENSGNASVISSAADFIARSKLTGVACGTTVNLPDNSYVLFNSPSIVTQIQAVVNRGDWITGNAIQFLLTRTGGTRTNIIRSYETGQGAQLHIRYVAP